MTSRWFQSGELASKSIDLSPTCKLVLSYVGAHCRLLRAHVLGLGGIIWLIIVKIQGEPSALRWNLVQKQPGWAFRVQGVGVKRS